jgi:hypothetical protein
MISAGLADQDPEMVAALDGVYLLVADVDEWGWTMQETGFDFMGIPIFFRLDENGAPTGDSIDGTAWGADNFHNFAVTMGPWFSSP